MLNFSHKEEVPTHPKVEEYVARAEGVVTAAEFLGFSTPSKYQILLKMLRKLLRKLIQLLKK